MFSRIKGEMEGLVFHLYSGQNLLGQQMSLTEKLEQHIWQYSIYDPLIDFFYCRDQM